MSMVVDWMFTNWNPILTLVATGLSGSLLVFRVYVYAQNRGRISEPTVSDVKMNKNGDNKLSFTLKTRNKGTEDVYIKDVYTVHNGDTARYSNFDAETMYSTQMTEDPVLLESHEPIEHIHFAIESLDGIESDHTAELVVETTNKTHRQEIEVEYVEDDQQ